MDESNTRAEAEDTTDPAVPAADPNGQVFDLAALNLNRRVADFAAAHGLDMSQPSAILSLRVGYPMAAAMLGVSLPQLRRYIREGTLPVIQPPTGRRKGLIEVRKLLEVMDTWRVAADREATSRAKSHAARRAG